MKKLQLTFNKKYKTEKRIGLGATTEIYFAHAAGSEKEHAIKLEANDHAKPTLEREAKFYRVLKGGVGIPSLDWYGVENNHHALVTEILGPSLDQLLKFCNGAFTLKTVLLVADQIIDRLEWVHSKGLVYNDIEPGNFLVGLAERVDKIFIVDFGSCKKYLEHDGTHLKLQQETQPFKANLKFKSVHAHIGKRTGRRDDLESLGYMLVYLLKGSLPWEELEVEADEDVELAVKEKKIGIPTALLCESLPRQFEKYFNYVNSLEYEEEPDYVWVKRLFRDLFDTQGFVNNLVFGWAEKHTP